MTGPTEVILAHSRAFRIGGTEVRPATREMIGPNVSEILEPRVMQVLVALAEADGEILSRDDLVERCWEGRAVSEDAINRAISKLRRVGETVAEGAFHIDTITKVGYRLVGDAGMAVEAVRADEPPIPKQPWVTRRTAVIGGLAIAGTGIAGWSLLGRGGRGPPPAAKQLYVRAGEIVRTGSPEQTAQAIGFLREAVALAPDYADAWGMLAIAYRLQADFEPPQSHAATSGRARGASQRARELDPGNINARAADALAFDLYGRWLAGETAARDVLAMDRDQPDMRVRLFWLLASVGRSRASIDAVGGIDGPFGMNPYVQYGLTYALWSAGRLEEADRTADRALSLWPRHYAVWFTRFWIYAFTGRAERALAMAADESGRPPGIPPGDFELVTLGARALATRTPADTEAAIVANRRVAPTGFGYCHNAIQIAAGLGRIDDALAFAQAYYFNRGFSVAPVLFSTGQSLYARASDRATAFLFRPNFGQLHETSQFRRLAEEIGLGDYWRRSGTRPDIWA